MRALSLLPRPLESRSPVHEHALGCRAWMPRLVRPHLSNRILAGGGRLTGAIWHVGVHRHAGLRECVHGPVHWPPRASPRYSFDLDRAPGSRLGGRTSSMKRDEYLAWLDRHAQPTPTTRGVLADAMDRLLAALPERAGLARLFQVALNDRDRFSVLKLVHVADWDGEPPAWAREAAGARRKAIGSILDRAASRLCAARYQQITQALEDAGQREFHPTVGIDIDAAGASIVETSLYTQHHPEAVAACVGRAILGHDIDVPQGLFAAGFDLVADGRVRLKLYTTASQGALAPSDALRALGGLPLTGVLSLRRRWLDGHSELDREPKMYAHFGNLPARTLISRCPAGRLGAFLSWAAPALEGQAIAFVSADDDKVELYFERSLKS